MARFARLKVLNEMIETGMVPVFYNADIEVAKKVAAAVFAGGCPLLEFTNRGDHAWEVFTDLERYCAKELPAMILGVGSVVDPGTASLYINCGANFVVGPILNPDVARACNRRKIPYSPGCGSASEISQAEELGCEIVKVFRVRDTSPQHNETAYSSVQTVVVSPLTGYHEIPLPRLAEQAEGTLVSFRGRISTVEADAYVVSADGAKIRVMPRTVASATDPKLDGCDVAVKGCLWMCRGEKRVEWAEVSK